MIKSYQKYILTTYLKFLFYITAIFFVLILILNVFEEISFFKDTDADLYVPLLLNFLNAPSILFNIFPFIFLISSQFFFLNLIEKNELIIFKSIGLENLRLVYFLSLISLAVGMLIILLFYNISSKLKFTYLDLKNDYASDNKYLAVINENGLWIRDVVDGNINIINADKVESTFLKNVTITQFDKDFNLKQYIYTNVVNAENRNWFIENAKISKSGIRNEIRNDFFFETNFSSEKINNLFSNLESFPLWSLYKLKKDYKEIGYSTSNIDLHLHLVLVWVSVRGSGPHGGSCPIPSVRGCSPRHLWCKGTQEQDCSINHKSYKRKDLRLRHPGGRVRPSGSHRNGAADQHVLPQNGRVGVGRTQPADRNHADWCCVSKGFFVAR